jgi:hypothetical protein
MEDAFLVVWAYDNNTLRVHDAFFPRLRYLFAKSAPDTFGVAPFAAFSSAFLLDKWRFKVTGLLDTSRRVLTCSRSSSGDIWSRLFPRRLSKGASSSDDSPNEVGVFWCVGCDSICFTFFDDRVEKDLSESVEKTLCGIEFVEEVFVLVRNVSGQAG